ncbi:MAG: lamin tail domain-containing protein [Chloroflexi bacterium]|nr:lamin tail domain-containing protein [Chloroflexota bacterium]
MPALRWIFPGRWLLAGLWALLILLLAGCSGGSVSTPALTASPSPTYAITPTPAKTTIATPPITETLPLATVVWPTLQRAEPAMVAPGETVTVFGTGGYFRVNGGYDESARSFVLTFDGSPIGKVDCYVNYCHGMFQAPVDAAIGGHVVEVEGGSHLTIEVRGPVTGAMFSWNPSAEGVSGLTFEITIDPPDPAVGDVVIVRVTARGEGGLPQYRLVWQERSQDILILESPEAITDSMLGVQANWTLRAVKAGSATFYIAVNYERPFVSSQGTFWAFTYEASEALTFSIKEAGLLSTATVTPPPSGDLSSSLTSTPQPSVTPQADFTPTATATPTPQPSPTPITTVGVPTATPSPTPTAPPTPTPTELVVDQSSVVIHSVDLIAEVVTIVNQGTASQDMTGWKLVSVVGNQTYYFPQGFGLSLGATIRVISGPDNSDQPYDSCGCLPWLTGIGAPSKAFIWNNDGDPGELYNAAGNLVSRFPS